MSVVIAIKEKDHIVMGCDKQVTMGELKLKTSNKIFDIKNCPNGVMGVVGNLRGSQLLQVQDNLINELNLFKDEIDFKYCVTELYEQIYNIFKAYRLVEKKNNEFVNYLDCDFIFAYKDKAFSIDGYGCVFEIDDFLVIGSGFETAQAVLLRNKKKNAETRIKEAIRVCAEKTLYIDNDVVIKSTKEKQNDKN